MVVHAVHVGIHNYMMGYSRKPDKTINIFKVDPIALNTFEYSLNIIPMEQFVAILKNEYKELYDDSGYTKIF
ncbi:hypothetical protein [Anaerocellum danielii]|uniref:hypothetical protein n=1 Tax=Anaerocellum danielii TaxID=1387557 RepID=UPI0005EBABD1|nr:hypothetical protein [Caldicellulosiruptor danielii]